jgi:hypothetical protein
MRAAVLDGQIDQESQVLLGPKANQLAGGREEGRLAQAPQKALRLHGVAFNRGEIEPMHTLQPAVNAEAT